MTVLGELSAEAASRRKDLDAILEGPIAELNTALTDLPTIVVPDATKKEEG